MKRKILLLSLLLCPVLAFGQEKAPFKNKYSVGVGVGVGLFMGDISEKNQYYESKAKGVVQPHLIFESQFTKHSGATLGISYTKRSKAISIPFMYKYYTPIVDVALGADLLLPVKVTGYADGRIPLGSLGPDAEPKVNEARLPFNYGYGAKLRLSKSFNFDQKWWFEPFFMMSYGKYDVTNDYLDEDNFMDISIGVSFRLEL